MAVSHELKEVADIGICFSKERSIGGLVEVILDKALEIANCDGGVLYLNRHNALLYSGARIISKNVKANTFNEKTVFQPIPLEDREVCTYAALHKETVNIENIKDANNFAFTVEKKFDRELGYQTVSTLVVPLQNQEGEAVGVLQLINAQNTFGKIVAFNAKTELLLRSLAAQAGISISNIIYLDEIKHQLYSFVEAFTALIDERTPYNGDHTRMVTVYASMIVDCINEHYKQGDCDDYLDENRREQLLMAAALHDIGKMAVPLSVMNKDTRLHKNLEKIEERFKLLKALWEIEYLKGRTSKEQYEQECLFLSDTLFFIKEINVQGILETQVIEKVQKLAEKFFACEDGRKIYYLSDYEVQCLTIKKGTLTEEERKMMQDHVVMTEKILKKMYFNEHYSKVPKYAVSHHEFLDGTGYPYHLKAEELELETRILTVADVYDALTASDRPYKKPLPKQKAMEVLHLMADEGKLEKRLVNYLEEAILEADILGFGKDNMYL